MAIIYLTIDQVLDLHTEALTLGGAEGLRSAHMLASAVLQAQQSAFGDDAYPSSQSKARASNAMSGAQSTKCPRCAGQLENVVTLQWTSPGTDLVDIGCCPACSRRIEVSRHTGRYQDFSWAPLCHVCGSQVKLERTTSDEFDRYYGCPDHPVERWQLKADDEWVWQGSPASPSARRLV